MASVTNCIFCGIGGRLTAEHTLPDWLLEDLKGDTGMVEFESGRPLRQKITWNSGKGEVPYKCVCGPCNHGWMSELEGDTQKFLADMLVGQAVTLSALDQAVLVVFTLVAGCFAAQVVAVGIKHDEPVTLRFNKDIEERVIAIRSPTPLIRSIDWPPKFSFEDGNTSLEDFAGRFTA